MNTSDHANFGDYGNVLFFPAKNIGGQTSCQTAIVNLAENVSSFYLPYHGVFYFVYVLFYVYLYKEQHF